MTDLYETDFAAWIDQTTSLLQNRKFDQLDIDALVEELEALKRSEMREIKKRLGRTCEHLLKLAYASDVDYTRNQRGWRISVHNARSAFDEVVADNPSLRHYPAQVFKDAYQLGLAAALAAFADLSAPDDSPWTLEKVTDNNWFPERSEG